MNRRQFFFTSGATLGAFAIPHGGVLAVPDEIRMARERVLFESDKPIPTIKELEARELIARGTASPYLAEVDKARLIVEKCPSKKNPIEIAHYFQDLRQGMYDESLGADTHLYGEEWPIRANPLIVQFFDATTYRTPSGDQTPWCAAFVNWCLVRARMGREDADKLIKHTESAASATFRSWGAATEEPKPGDIVVFRHKRDSGRGHVGFFVSRTGGGIFVLGGNQMPLRVAGGTYERHNTGEINIKRMPVDGGDLALHSFRTDPSLHDL